MKSKELITIGITCFNAEDSIQRCLNSAVKQDYENFDIIIIDDCSTDNSVRVIKKFVERNPNIKMNLIENKKNLGVGANRQKILEEAEGNYITFFDDDDESYPSRLRVQYEHIKNIEEKGYSKGVLCYASGDREYENGYRKELPSIGSVGNPIKGEKVAGYLLAFERDEKLFYGSGTPTCSLMFKRNIALKSGGFDKNFRRVEDADFAINMGLKGAVFTGVKEKCFRQYATTSEDKSYFNNYQAEIQLIEKYEDFLNQKKIYSYAKLWTKLRYLRYEKKYLLFAITLLRLVLTNPYRTLSHASKTFPKRIKHELKIKGLIS